MQREQDIRGQENFKKGNKFMQGMWGPVREGGHALEYLAGGEAKGSGGCTLSTWEPLRVCW